MISQQASVHLLIVNEQQTHVKDISRIYIDFSFEVICSFYKGYSSQYFPSQNQVNYKKIKPLLGKSKRILLFEK
jgi:hypothetical protein